MSAQQSYGMRVSTRDGPALDRSALQPRCYQFSDVPVPEPIEHVFPTQHRLEQFCFLSFDRSKRTVRVALLDDPAAQRIEDLLGGSRFNHYCHRLEIALIGGATDLQAPGNVGQTLPDWQPLQARLAVAGRFPEPLEVPRVVHRRFDPQYALLLVVHFEIDIRAPRPFDHCLDMVFDGLGEFANKRAKTSVQDTVIFQESIKAVTIADGSECATEEDPVEARQDASNAALMSLQETLHVAPAENGVAQYHHPKVMTERHFDTSHFGCGREAALGKS
ncbi:MAG: hypothetical protein ACLP7Q_03970 [Isosphaeraceae bacterium]